LLQQLIRRSKVTRMTSAKNGISENWLCAAVQSSRDRSVQALSARELAFIIWLRYLQSPLEAGAGLLLFAAGQEGFADKSIHDDIGMRRKVGGKVVQC